MKLTELSTALDYKTEMAKVGMQNEDAEQNETSRVRARVQPAGCNTRLHHKIQGCVAYHGACFDVTVIGLGPHATRLEYDHPVPVSIETCFKVRPSQIGVFFYTAPSQFHTYTPE